MKLFKRRGIPKLTGYPQAVQFQGQVFHIVRVSARYDRGETTSVQIDLIDEGTYNRERRVSPGEQR